MLLALFGGLAMLPSNLTTFHAGDLTLSINQSGWVDSIHVLGNVELVPASHPSPLMSLKLSGQVIEPKGASWRADKQEVILDFGGFKATVKVRIQQSHFSMELTGLTPKKAIETVIWGPYATTLHESIGETIGVVQGKGTAFGLQVLNIKTLGGYPNTDDDIEPSYDIFESGNLVDMNERDALTDNYRGDTARPTDFGSVVQAYTRDRSQTRIIENWGHKFYTAPSFKDGGVIGSKVALFGCPQSNALQTIGEIEVAEGLPHPMIDGVWGKLSPTAHESYFVMGYDSKNLQECIDVTKAAGLKYLYTDGGFETWGHFKLDPNGFPKGWDSLKESVQKAKAQGVRLGIHTLSNFITTNDAYVTPKPDPRLAEVGASSIVSQITADQTEIEIADPKFFNQMSNNTLKTVRIGDELVEYGHVSSESPWKLMECKRGGFGTHPVAHAKGARIAKLMDHGYKTFLTNAELSKEVAANIAKLFNHTGMLQLSMDGLEGNWSTGMGQYGRTLFAKTWFDHLDPSIKGEVINDASNPGAFNWHIYTRMNWGEPWYAGFRKSQTLYRMKNQRYFKRNLMPGMLGWFLMNRETTVEDIQWLLARAAGFDAGFCITTSLDAFHQNANSKEILSAVKAWESARHAHAFPNDLKPDLQKIDQEYELEQTSERTWQLTPIRSQKAVLTQNPVAFDFKNVAGTRFTKLVMIVPKKVSASDIEIMLDGKLIANHVSIVGGYAHFQWDLSEGTQGLHHVTVSARISGEGTPSVDLELRNPIDGARTLEANQR